MEQFSVAPGTFCRNGHIGLLSAILCPEASGSDAQHCVCFPVFMVGSKSGNMLANNIEAGRVLSASTAPALCLSLGQQRTYTVFNRTDGGRTRASSRIRGVDNPPMSVLTCPKVRPGDVPLQLDEREHEGAHRSSCSVPRYAQRR